MCQIIGKHPRYCFYGFRGQQWESNFLIFMHFLGKIDQITGVRPPRSSFCLWGFPTCVTGHMTSIQGSRVFFPAGQVTDFANRQKLLSKNRNKINSPPYEIFTINSRGLWRSALSFIIHHWYSIRASDICRYHRSDSIQDTDYIAKTMTKLKIC